MHTERIQRAREIGTLLALFLLYAYFKRNLSTVTAGDHGVYFYISYLWTQGVVPYRDVFISHPPVQLLVSTLTILIFGKSIIALNALPMIMSMGSGLLVFLITKRSYGTWTGLLATALFLFSYENLSVSLYYTGQNIGLFFLLLSFFLFLRGSIASAGIASGIAIAASINMLIGFAALFVVQFLSNRRALLRLLGGFVASAGTIHGLFTIIAGKAFWENVYLYHLQKVETTRLASVSEVFSFMFQNHVLLTVLAVSSLFVCVRNWKSCKQNALLFLTSIFTVFYCLFLLSLNPLFSHYFIPLAASFAILAAVFLKRMMQWPQTSLVVAIGILGIGVLWTASGTLDTYRTEKAFTRFVHATDIVEHMQKTLEPDQAIYGDFGVVPTIAFLSGRRIAGNEVESSVMRFQSGLHDLDEVIATIEEENVGAILTRRMRAIGAYPPFKKYLERKYFLERTFSAPGSGTVVEYWRRK